MCTKCCDMATLPSRVAMHIRQRLGDTKLLVHFLVIIFATSSWADMNGLWVELPLFVLKAPERWNLPSYITIISQVANVGPLLFVGLSILLPHTKHKLEKITSFVIIIIGTMSAFLLAFFWDKTSYVGGTEHSTALLVLNFFLALGDCTSSVCFYAFMSLLKPQYMASLFFGEGLSGMFPAMIALAQGAGDILCVNESQTTNKTFPNGTEYNTTTYSVYPEYVDPNFSVQVFFFTLTAILASSGIAFLLLNILPACRSEMVDSAEYEIFIQPENSDIDQTSHQSNFARRTTNRKNNYGAADDCDTYNSLPSPCASQSSSDAETEMVPRQTRQNFLSPDSMQNLQTNNGYANPTFDNSVSNSLKIYLRLPNINLLHFAAFLCIIVIINLTLTSFLSTIQIYSTLPYGLQPYHLTTTLVAIANPVACFVALLFMVKGLAVISGITLLGLAGVGYIIYLAVSSPTPPLHGQDSGAVLAVGTWIVTTLLLIYAKVCVAGVMRQHGRNVLIWAGVATQVGSLIGAMVGFIMTEDTHVFVQAKYCS